MKPLRNVQTMIKFDNVDVHIHGILSHLRANLHNWAVGWLLLLGKIVFK